MVTDFEKALAGLTGGAVQFIVIGGVAAALHGSAFITQDLGESRQTDWPQARRWPAQGLGGRGRVAGNPREKKTPRGALIPHQPEELARSGNEIGVRTRGGGKIGEWAGDGGRGLPSEFDVC